MERAAAFDAMGTLFDLTALRPRLEALGAPGTALEAWFERTLHAAAVVTMLGQLRPFGELARSSLESTLAQLDLDPAGAAAVVDALPELPAFADAAAAIERLRDARLGVLVLTNGAAETTRTLLERNGLAVDGVVTTAEAGAYKPDPRPYRLAAERAGVPPERLALVAAHAWDCLGAERAGLRSVWVERLERRWPLPLPPVALRAPDLAAAAAALVEDRTFR